MLDIKSKLVSSCIFAKQCKSEVNTAWHSPIMPEGEAHAERSSINIVLLSHQNTIKNTAHENQAVTFYPKYGHLME